MTFTDCELSGAQFRSVSVDAVRINRCVLDGISGVASLAGAVIDPLDLIGLTFELAAALGITVDTGVEVAADDPNA